MSQSQKKKHPKKRKNAAPQPPQQGTNLYTTCLLIGCGVFGLSLLMQIHLLVSGYWRSGMSLREGSGLIVGLLWSQPEHLLIAVLAAAAYGLMHRARWSRILYALVLGAYLLFLSVNQIFYLIFFTHLQWIPGKTTTWLNPARVWNSVLVAFSPGLVGLLMLTLGMMAYFASRLLPQQERQTKPLWYQRMTRHPAISALVFDSLVLLSLFRPEPAYHLFRHPVIAFAHSLFVERDTQTDLMASDDERELFRLRYGTASGDAAEERHLHAYAQRQAGRTPNIVFIVLESVGALNLLPRDGLPDETATPHVASYLPHSVLFPTVYTSFPGSQRSHLALSTGGRTYTWERRISEEDFVYTGPTLVREMARRNYRNGLFAATFMDTEGFIEGYRHEPFEESLIPDLALKDYVTQHQLNSWGLDEREVLHRLTAWIGKDDREQPFFGMFLTSNTHHPYAVPEGYQTPFDGKDGLTRYRNALHFADSLIHDLVESLRKQDMLENTIIAVTGDHGEAFGQYHPENYAHRNHLYEENIRSFLWLLDFRENDGPIVSQKQGDVGDIMPTLLSLAYAQTDTPVVERSESPDVSLDIPGQNLFSPGYQSKIRYIHKVFPPAKWGLIDGEWKFTIRKADQTQAELYNLRNDPHEQHNLAAQYPERIAEYDELCATWYARATPEFTAYLQDFEEYTDLPVTAETVRRRRPGNSRYKFFHHLECP